MKNNEAVSFFLVAGEASGDRLGAGLITALKKHYPNAVFEGVGGPRMQAAGLKCLYSFETLAVMGVWEVIKRLPKIVALHRKIVRYIHKSRPTVYIGIDAPDTNLRIAKKIRHLPVKIVHYVCPSILAWRKGRLKTIKHNIDLMLTLFPFEAEVCQDHLISAYCVGHAMAYDIPLNTPDCHLARKALSLAENAPTLALLPGSRESELAAHSQIFLSVAKQCQQKYTNLQVVVPLTTQEKAKQFRRILDKLAMPLEVTLVINNMTQALSAADVALVVSGTATLECMLYKRPMVVAYKMSPLTFFLAKRLVDFSWMAFPNLLAQKRLVPEYLQDDVEPSFLTRMIIKLLDKKNVELIEQFSEIHKSIKKDSSFLAAEAIKQHLLPVSNGMTLHE